MLLAMFLHINLQIAAGAKHETHYQGGTQENNKSRVEMQQELNMHFFVVELAPGAKYACEWRALR